MPDDLPNNEDPGKAGVDNPPADTGDTGNEAPPNETPDTKPATADQVAETNRILQDVADSLKTKPGSAAPSTEQMRNLIKEKTGLSDEGIDWVMAFNRETVTAAVAPLGEKVAWNEIVQSKATSKFPISGEIEKGMKEELKQYPKAMLGDNVLLEKVYLMEVGKAMIKNPPKPNDPNPSPNNNPVVRRTIVNNNPAPGGANGGGGNPPPAGTQLSAEEKEVARKMGCSEAEYSKWKKTTVITPVGAGK